MFIPKVSAELSSVMRDTNVEIINWIQSTLGDSSRPFFDFFSTFGGPLGWLLMVSLLFWLSGSKSGLRVGFATALGTITNTMLKWAFACQVCEFGARQEAPSSRDLR